MITVYRVIKFEFHDEKDMIDQLRDSVAPGVYQIRINSRMTIRDRRDDPCERQFFESVPDPRPRYGVITSKEYDRLPLSARERLYLP